MSSEEKLVKMLKYVAEHNDFYKNRIKEYGINNPLDITQWPVLTRKELQENRYNMFSDGYKSKYFSKQLRTRSSSGSSGVPINVYWSDEDYYASIKSLYKKRMDLYGVNPKNKQVIFGLDIVNSDSLTYINNPANILNINFNSIYSNHEYKKMLSIINNYAPEWLCVRPYILQRLIMTYREFDIIPPKSIKYIESFGEILPNDLLINAQQLFNVHIADMYGSEEMNCIAFQYPDGIMRVFNDNVFVECLSSEKQSIDIKGEGEAIITNLKNRAMPLIRYNQGDEIVLKTATNKQNNICVYEQIIETIKGRTIDSIEIDNLYKINSSLFLEMMGDVNNLYNNIFTYYKFVYNERTRDCICYIELEEARKSWFQSVVESIDEVFKKRIPIELGINLMIRPADSSKILAKKYRIFEVV